VEDQAAQGRHTITGIEETANQRRKFSRADNSKIMQCYYRSEPNKRGYMQRMDKIWKDRGGFTLTTNRLTMQARVIVNKKWLISEELDEIKMREMETYERDGEGDTAEMTRMAE